MEAHSDSSEYEEESGEEENTEELDSPIDSLEESEGNHFTTESEGDTMES